MSLTYSHVDVFTDRPFGGNSLPVFPDARGLSADQMLRITQELRHFEAIFLEPTDEPTTVRARIFDLSEELPFAGHPIIGAAAVLHRQLDDRSPQNWRFELAGRTVEIATEKTVSGFSGWLDQGVAAFSSPVQERAEIAGAFNLSPDDLAVDLPMEVVSTGLRYLIVPVVAGALPQARIARDITTMLGRFDAQFAVLFDESGVEVRHWNNDGVLEDVATGSAAGTIGAYRLRHGLVASGTTFNLHQGRFTGRPSLLRVFAQERADGALTVRVGGDVCIVGHGVIDAPP